MEGAVTAARSDAAKRPPSRPAQQLRVLGPLAAALALIPFAVTIRYTADFGLAYHGGIEAWATGHPERVFSWFSTPFLALVMGVITRIAPVELAAHLFLVLNLLLWGGLLVVVWGRLHVQVPARWWWITLVAAGAFSPAISTVYWMSFNLVVFVLAVAGFALIGRHDRLAGLLIGLSLAVKPILILFPLALLVRRQSRSAGLWAIVAAAGLSSGGLVFLAWRAGDPSVLNPFAYLTGFVAKTHGPLTACVAQNYSQMALLCRLGLPTSTALSVVFAAAIVGLGWLLIRRFPPSSERAWELLAVACLLSPLVGPIDWATYQLLFGPVMLLLAYQFWAERAPLRLWAYLVVAFLMCELVWDPVESLARAPVAVLVLSYTLGQFAQYVLLLLLFYWIWIRSHRLAPA
jgi:hypothetical protein